MTRVQNDLIEELKLRNYDEDKHIVLVESVGQMDDRAAMEALTELQSIRAQFPRMFAVRTLSRP